MWVFSSLLVLSCSAPESPSSGAAQPALPSAYDGGDYLDTGSVESAYDDDAAGAALEAAVASALANDPSKVVEGYQRAMVGAAALCPTDYEVTGDITSWHAYCESSSGTMFDGFAFYSAFTAYAINYDPSVYVTDGVGISGSMRITDPDGATFELGGAMIALAGRATDGSSELTWAGFTGYFADAASDAEWLQDGVSLHLSLRAIEEPTVDGRYVSLDGSLGGFADDWTAAEFGSTTFIQESLGSGCEQEPGGTISLRDAEGDWYDVAFDGPTADNYPGGPGACDGCGTVSLHGVEIGQACADFSVAFDWEDSPW